MDLIVYYKITKCFLSVVSTWFFSYKSHIILTCPGTPAVLSRVGMEF